MKVYVASSWKSTVRHSHVVSRLRREGFDVYDFMMDGRAFPWRDANPAYEDLNKRGDVVEFIGAIQTPIAKTGFQTDMDALLGADIVVLVLPCGRSAHLALGIAIGKGKPTFVLLDEPLSDWDLMYLATDGMTPSVDKLVEAMHQRR